MQWVSDESDGAITCAAYSSDGEIIYVGSRSGSIKILDSKTFRTICKINLTAFTRPVLSIIRYSFFAYKHLYIDQI